MDLDLAVVDGLRPEVRPLLEFAGLEFLDAGLVGPRPLSRGLRDRIEAICLGLEVSGSGFEGGHVVLERRDGVVDECRGSGASRASAEGPAVALAVGSQFPDLIDKPLGWSLDLLPGGRTLGHSVFFAIPLILVAYVWALRDDRVEAAAAFVGGHLSHLVADVPPAALTGDVADLTFLFWPVLEQPEYETVGGIVDGFLRYSMGPYEWVQVGLIGVAVAVWYRDGSPGVRYARGALERTVAVGR